MAELGARREPYSIAACQGSDPQAVLKNAESKLLQASTGNRGDFAGNLKLEWLARASKAAWEAGLNDKALSYAREALALARRDRCIDAPGKPPLDNREPRETSSLNSGFAERAAQDFCNAPWTGIARETEGDAVATSDWVLGRIALSGAT